MPYNPNAMASRQRAILFCFVVVLAATTPKLSGRHVLAQHQTLNEFVIIASQKEFRMGEKHFVLTFNKKLTRSPVNFTQHWLSLLV